jgi:hypothetical protein
MGNHLPLGYDDLNQELRQEVINQYHDYKHCLNDPDIRCQLSYSGNLDLVKCRIFKLEAIMGIYDRLN